MDNRTKFYVELLIEQMRPDDGRVCVEAYPILLGNDGVYRMRLFMYRYYDETGRTDYIMNRPMTALEMSYLAHALRIMGYVSTAGRIDKCIYKYFEKVGFKFVLRPSMERFWRAK